MVQPAALYTAKQVRKAREQQWLSLAQSCWGSTRESGARAAFEASGDRERKRKENNNLDRSGRAATSAKSLFLFLFYEIEVRNSI
jgi:hypothetical protein